MDWIGLVAVLVPTAAVVLTYWLSSREIGSIKQKMDSMLSMFSLIVGFMHGERRREAFRHHAFLEERGLPVPKRES